MNTINNTFKVKGFHLDLRIQIMTIKALKLFVDEITMIGLNTIVMEYEASYPFKKHPLISNALSYTEKEIDEFLKYCKQKILM